MDDQEKPFGTVSIVLLMLISLANDAAEVFFDLLAATVIGIPGEAIMEIINFAVDAVVTPWFFMKCGFGGPSLAQILDDVLSAVGVPGRTICVSFGIYVANNPNSFFGKIGKTAAAIETGGESGALSEGLQEGETVAKEAESAAETAVKTEKGAAAEMETKQPKGKPSESNEEETKKEQAEKNMEPEEEREPEEVAEEKIFEETPRNQDANRHKTDEQEDESSGMSEQSNLAGAPRL